VIKRAISVGSATLYPEDLFLIAGPCVIENEAVAFETAEKLKEICAGLKIPYIFKSSFDKANRTSVSSFRGPGIEKGLRILADIRAKLQIPVISDIHAFEEIKPASEVLDALQIPAFLCRQTDLILAAAKTGKPVNIKKGQFLAPWDIKNIIDKFTSTGNQDLFITERGVSFGYNNLVVDFRAFPIMRSFGYPVIFDVTHSLQLPGGQGMSSGGQREFAGPLARAAIAAGVNGLFMEVHPEPEQALCDGPNMIRLRQMSDLLKKLKALHDLVSAQADDTGGDAL
jgi:2-dehydro-3-deoxyphosphooctonate aldolase (KDO 8-P synthase)